MTIIAVASAKGRGVTTTAELLVLLRPTGRRCVLVDADPAGGDWLLRPGVAPEPGLVSLALAGRRRLEPGELFNHVQAVGAVEVVVGPPDAPKAAAALDTVGPRLAAHVRTLTEPGGSVTGEVDAVVDCGRLARSSPASVLALQADLVVVVNPATAAGLVHLPPVVDLVREAGVAVGVVLFGGEERAARYGEGEVAAAVGCEVLGTMADDPAGAAGMAESPGGVEGRGCRRLVRSMGPVVARAWDVARRPEPVAATGPAATWPPPPSARPSRAYRAPMSWKEQPDG